MPTTSESEFIDDTSATALAGWLPRQRWFAATGASITSIRVVSRIPLVREPDLLADHLLVSVGSGHLPDRLYQVPLAFRPDRHRRVSDGMHDPAVVGHLMRSLATGTAHGGLTPHPIADVAIDSHATVRALGGEQSHTSMVIGDRLLFKLFRQITPGLNPDVEIPLALTRTHCRATVPLRGWFDIELDDVTTTLATVTDLIPDARDGWDLAVADVRAGAAGVSTRFHADARAMGAAVAHVHDRLAAAFGTSTVPTAEQIDVLLARARATAREVPALAGLFPAIRERLLAAADGSRLRVQRVHGDLHLGQVLHGPDGWLLVDFEGEPAAPIAERRRPASVWRDVAGMLRSFDYAAAQCTPPAHDWARRASTAFCDGYAAASGIDPSAYSAVLRAYEIDKAVYEVGYETRHRPGWVDVPLAALRRLLTSRSGPTTSA